MEYKKPNNSNDGELQPYDPANGEYLSKHNDIGNYYARKLGGLKEEFPLHFPTKDYPLEYIHDYFNTEINWNDVVVSDNKMKFLIDINSPKRRYLIFRNCLGYNEANVHKLKQQIINNASLNQVFVSKGCDDYGFRVRIYMPIKFANSNEQLMIKTCWLISEGEKPLFVTAMYDKNYKKEYKDEI